MSSYDALLVVSFGGPEGPDDVIPFLENVLRGRNVPRERMLEVAHHYEQFGGVSPINAQNRALSAALKAELAAHGPALPIYWGNRNWHPLLADTLQQMADDGVRRALAFVTSAYSSYSGCRQYRENIAQARAAGVLQSPRVYPADGRTRTAGPGADSPAASRQRRTGLHRAQHPHLHGCNFGLRNAAARGLPAGFGAGRRGHGAVGVSKPQRSAVAALA